MDGLLERIPVPVPGAAYDVLVGVGLLDRLAGLLPVPAHARRAALVTTGPVADRYGAPVRAALGARDLDVVPLPVPDGEEAKTLGTLESAYHRLAAAQVGRDDLVVTLGGGVVTDLGGFLAATWHRGVRVVHVPTTLLGQVDAAVGGKTGVNLAEGKNLVGAFHQPAAVVCDTATLATLPDRELRSGLGEVAKYGFIADPAVLDLLERDPDAARAGDPAVLTEVVRRGVAVKARVVAADEREAGDRALLNYGHTFGHAIETETGYGVYAHGEAVALGMVAAARLAERLGVAERGLAERTVALLAALGLPTGGLAAEPHRLWEAMTRDKKVRRVRPSASEDGGRGSDGGVRFVLCRRPGDAFLTDPLDREPVLAVLGSLR